MNKKSTSKFEILRMVYDFYTSKSHEIKTIKIKDAEYNFNTSNYNFGNDYGVNRTRLDTSYFFECDLIYKPSKQKLILYKNGIKTNDKDIDFDIIKIPDYDDTEILLLLGKKFTDEFILRYEE